MPGNAEFEAAAERRGEAKPRARRLLESAHKSERYIEE
jgi:hypothetical protein